VKWVPQAAEAPGLLLAVDAQPDNSVARKRFWEGTFLFASDLPSAGAGFKAFRPLLGTGRGVRPATNGELRRDLPFIPYSAEQGQLKPAAFYARLDQLINPAGLDPQGAYDTTLAALVEQLETRGTSIANGGRFHRRNPGILIPMPEGVAIFETTGPWEDNSTPARDMRLLIALRVLADLPARIRRFPGLFVLRGETPAAAAARSAQLNERRLAEPFITYQRSDGSQWRLSLADIYERRAALEMGYNPNDCPEVRWGAPAGSAEVITCDRHAPRDQRARMETYREWFRDARRSPP